jgi:16S rRNA (adenine1518-N6/adenine1519-N6)-dimethyltransferase
MVKAGFNQRRKTLRNSLKSFIINRDEKVDALLQKRAERLTVEDFEFLAGRVKMND